MKKDLFEMIVQKATELGVTHIVPVVSERSEKKSINDERLKKILTEAAEQSLRSRLPTLHPIKSLEEALSDVIVSPRAVRVALHTSGEPHLRETLNSPDVSLFIGPEGGWSESELTLFKEHSVKIFSLKAPVLRSETAAIAALTLALLS